MIAPYNCVVMANGRFHKQLYHFIFCIKPPSSSLVTEPVEALDKAGITPTAIVGDPRQYPIPFS